MPTTTYLSDLRDRIRIALHDTDDDAYKWSDDELDEHIARALSEFSDASPVEATTKIDCTAGTKIYDLASISDLTNRPTAIFAVECPYDASHPTSHPVPFRVLANHLYLLTGDAPAASDDIQVYYWQPHTLSESACTLSPEDQAIIILGATAYAGLEQQRAAAGMFTQPDSAAKNYKAWSSPEISRFNRALMDKRQERGMAAANTVAWKTDGI